MDHMVKGLLLSAPHKTDRYCTLAPIGSSDSLLILWQYSSFRSLFESLEVTTWMDHVKPPSC